MNAQPQVIVSGGFDDIRSRHLRFLEEAAKFGELTVLLWPDAVMERVTGKPSKFPLAERLYFLNAVRYVSRVIVAAPETHPDTLPFGMRPELWVADPASTNGASEQFAAKNGIAYRVLTEAELSGFPPPPSMTPSPGRRRVVATGCYDWFHTGHVRFIEEASAHGDLYLIVGHDANIRLLKGRGPLLSEAERRYVVGSIRHVKQALISSGDSWLDADPEIRAIKPDVYVVNEDGDKGGKRDYCQQMGIKYLVLQRTPAPGLPRRSSTNLRGF